MRSRLLGTTIAMAALASVPASAGAATTMGDADATPNVSGLPSAQTWIQTVGPGIPAAGRGVITRWRAKVSTTATPADLVFKVLRPITDTTYEVISERRVTPPASSTAVVTFDGGRQPVEPGDVTAVTILNAASANVAGAAGYPGAQFRTAPGDPLPGSTATTAESLGTGLFVMEARLEPDVDGDGYGDETQDSCPSPTAIHSGPCTGDLSVTASFSPASVVAGDVSTYSATVTNAGPRAAQSTAIIALPAGLPVVSAYGTGAACTGTGTLTCPMGSIPGGQSRIAQVVVRPPAAGTKTVGVAANGDTTELTPGDNTATATLTATAPPPPQTVTQTTTETVTTPAPPPVAGTGTTGTGTTGSTGTSSGSGASGPSVKLCTVPRLRGLTKTAAAKKLKTARCALGAAKGSKKTKAKAKSQTIPAGTKVLAGTKVGLTLR